MRIQEEFLSQKQYSENLSHELLTPLAIIRSKAELLMQSPQLNEESMLNLDSIIQTAGRLTKVNQALILLSKIENNQFVDEERIHLNDIINESLGNFEDQIRKKKLKVRMNLKESSELYSNLNLMRVLISNLIKNAVFHNVDGGSIQISLEEKTLIIVNSGIENKHSPEEFFKRFVSSQTSDNSVGLGLSIVKRICTLFSYSIMYETKEEMHTITLHL